MPHGTLQAFVAPYNRRYLFCHSYFTDILVRNDDVYSVGVSYPCKCFHKSIRINTYSGRVVA